MGIQKLMSLIQEKCPQATKETKMDMFSGKVVACDASMTIYHFIIATQAIRQGNSSIAELRDEEGNLTGHLVGLFHKTINLFECGIKPIWVFDGEPPKQKTEELKKRKEAKENAKEQQEMAEENGDLDRAKAMAGRSVRITPDMVKDAKTLLSYMGCAIIQAPQEAEAQCAELVKNGIAYAVATDDMDVMAHGATFQIRGFNAQKDPIVLIEYKAVLESLNLTAQEFIDLCILCGSDYTGTIQGMGPSTAYKYLVENKNIEGVLRRIKNENLNAKKKKPMVIPEDFDFENARHMFSNPEVIKDVALLNSMIKFGKADEKNLKEFLCYSKGFGEQKVDSGIQKLKKWQCRPNQSRLSNFFKLPEKAIEPVNQFGLKVQTKGKQSPKSKRELLLEKQKEEQKKIADAKKKKKHMPKKNNY